MLEEEAWREFTTPRGELIRHEKFLDFLLAPPTAGLGADIALVRRIVANDPVASGLLEHALKDAQNPDQNTSVAADDSHEEQQLSKTQQAALKRLQRDAPEIYKKVAAGELSANAAMVEAGFRTKTFSVPATRPEACARSLKKNLSETHLRELIKLLTDT
ncbi:hypothetical protein [Streptomyces sp. NPDC054808]